MTDKTKQERTTAALLKDLSLRASPAFPNFELLFDKRRTGIDRRVRAIILTLGLAAGLAAGLGIGSLTRDNLLIARGEPLIDSWFPENAYNDSVSSSRQDLAIYIQDLWESSSLNANTLSR